MSSRTIRSCILYAVAIFMTFAPLAWAFANPDVDDMRTNDDYRMKATYIADLARWIDWPNHKFTQPDSPLVIGVVGTDPFGGLLEEDVQDKHINDHTVIVRHIESMEEMRKCHILFICRSESGRLSNIINYVHGDNVLTVADTEKFIARGGMINLVNVGNSIKLEINDGAAKHAGIKISSKLAPMTVPVAR